MSAQRKDLAGAERLMRQAATLMPASPSAHRNLGMVLFAQDKLDEAQQVLTLAKALASVANNKEKKKRKE